MEGQVGRGSGLASKQSPRPQARASTQDLTPTPDPDSEIGELWSALTDPRRLAGWFADVQGDLRRGGEFHAHIFNSGDVTGRVEACESPYRLLVSIRDADPQPGQPEEEVIEVTLTTDDDETTLIWEERGMPANLLAASATNPGAIGNVFNIATGSRISLNDLMPRIQKSIGTSVPVRYEPEREGDIKHSGADIASARALLGFDPQTALEFGLRQTAQYYRAAAKPVS